MYSGPSGVGKGRFVPFFVTDGSELVYSVSATTRLPRQGEVDGVNYFFKSKEQFQDMIARDALLEYAEYVGNYYGTPRDFVERTLAERQGCHFGNRSTRCAKGEAKVPKWYFCIFVASFLDELKERIRDVVRSRNMLSTIA